MKTMDELIKYVKDNVDMDEVFYTFSKMCINRSCLRVENSSLYNQISDLVDDFGCDNGVDVSCVYIDEVFDGLFED